jgi:ankyrin repeat protein
MGADIIDRKLTDRLIQAVGDNDVTAVRELLEQGADPNARAAQTGLTVLMMAACQANLDLVKLLLDAGADVLAADRRTGATPLHKACQGGSAEIARLLLERGAFVDAVTPTMGHTPIMDALWYKWPEVVKVLLDYGANLHFGTHYGFTLFDHLAFELNVNVEGKAIFLEVERMFNERQAWEEQEMAGQKVTAALRDGDPGRARREIAAGEPVNTVYPHVNSFFDGHTPLLVAARDGHAEVVKDLLAAGADVRPVDWTFKGSPIHKATYNGRTDILRMLMDAPGTDLNVQGQINGYTPLHDALWHGYTECARMLIDAGARLDLRGHDGKLPVDVAADAYGVDSEMVRYIRDKMAR